MPSVQDWLDLNILYRIPRNLTTTGIRVLGRLAFVEHFRSIANRLRRELQDALAPEALAAAEKRTGLARRSNWPQIYVVTSLAGGTGSGMFLDVAYLLKLLLRELGYSRQDVTGLFVVPPADTKVQTDLALANTYAALTELHHFMGGQPFFARYEARRPPLIDKEPPFRRCLFLGVSPDAEGLGQREASRLAGECLYRELLTPLGRQVDGCRPDPADLPEDRLLPAKYQTANLRVLASPRRQLVRRAARRLCRSLLEGWTVRSVPGLAEPIAAQLTVAFKEMRLEPEGLLGRLQAACTAELGRDVMAEVEQVLAPLRALPDQWAPDLVKAREAMAELDALLGAAHETVTMRAGRLPEALRKSAEEMVRELGPQLTDVALRYLGMPGYRLAGVEEALRFLIATLQQWLQAVEQQANQAAVKVAEVIQRIRADITEWERLQAGGKLRRAAPPGDPAVTLREYVAHRLRQVLAQRQVGIYLSLRGCLSDQVKDLRFCRQQLNELQQMFVRPAVKDSHDAVRAVLLPHGCATLDEAVELVVAGFTGEELLRLDRNVQAALDRQFPPLAQASMQPGDILRQIGQAVTAEVEQYLNQVLPVPDVADLILGGREADDSALANELLGTFEEAQPTLLDRCPRYDRELTVATVPDSDAGRQLAAALQGVVGDMTPVHSSDPEEVVIYREATGLGLAHLPQMGQLGRTAYETAQSIEHFTCHARQDITKWQGPS
jgi:hypothetical protein